VFEISLRSAAKARMRAACGAEKEALDAEQQALKILANATSYGFRRTDRRMFRQKKTRLCFGSGVRAAG
jgi:DNA polymerase elongation subunit (family B)